MTALDGVALVTGGGRGIGEVIARRLAADGMRVALSRRSADRIELVADEIGGLALAGDVSDERDVARWVETVERELGPVELLVNNAGVADDGLVAWEQSAADWWRVLQVNLLGPYLCARALLPGMIERDRGRIVNVASNAAFIPRAESLPPMSAYGTSKAALVRLTELLAQELEGSSVVVLAISPGMVRTAMTAGFIDALPPDTATPAERSGDLVSFIATGALDAFTGRFVHARVDDWERLPVASTCSLISI